MGVLNRAGRRYMARFAPAMLAYGVAITVLKVWIRSATPPRGLVLDAAAIGVAVPILAVIWAMGRYLAEESDEYLRMQLARALLWSTGLTLASATVWGFLEELAAAPHLPAYWGFILFLAVLGVCRALQRLVRS